MASSEMSNTQQKVNIDFAQALQVQFNAGCKENQWTTSKSLFCLFLCEEGFPKTLR